MVVFNVIRRCLDKSFCNNLMNFKRKSKVPKCNSLQLKSLGVCDTVFHFEICDTLLSFIDIDNIGIEKQNVLNFI